MFFADPPELAPEDLPTQRHFDHPWSRPEHWLPGTANVAAVIGRAQHTAVRLAFLESFPRGVFFEVRALLSPEGDEVDHVINRPTPFVSDLRLGMRWPDGRRVESSSHWHPHLPHGEAADALHLSMMGGGGGGLSWSWNAWLWPLPVYVEGGDHGWTSYSPLGSTFSALSIGDIEPSRDGLDARDEDG